jgi:hypothetical protein
MADDGEKEGVEGRGYTVMNSTSQNETQYQNESIPFCDPLTVTKETYHGARTHYVAIRSTTWDYHSLVHLSGYLALLRRIRRVARGSAHAAPQPMTLTPLSVTHTIIRIRSHCPYCQDVGAYFTASQPKTNVSNVCSPYKAREALRASGAYRRGSRISPL